VAVESDDEIKGDRFFKENSYAEALTIFEEMLNAYDDDTPDAEKNIFLFFKCAACYEAMKNWDELLEIASEIIELEVGRPEGYEFGGLALFQLDQLESAQQILMKGLRSRDMGNEHKLLLLERLHDVDEALLVKAKKAKQKIDAELLAAEELASNPPTLIPTQSTTNIFECPICLRIMEDPVGLTCGHSGCLKCLETYFKSDAGHRQPECANCRYDLWSLEGCSAVSLCCPCVC